MIKRGRGKEYLLVCRSYSTYDRNLVIQCSIFILITEILRHNPIISIEVFLSELSFYWSENSVFSLKIWLYTLFFWIKLIKFYLNFKKKKKKESYESFKLSPFPLPFTLSHCWYVHIAFYTQEEHRSQCWQAQHVSSSCAPVRDPHLIRISALWRSDQVCWRRNDLE